MAVYRERYAIERPPAMIARRVAGRRGEPIDGPPDTNSTASAPDRSRSSGRDRWNTAGRVYRERITLDPERGVLDREVAVRGPFRALLVAVLGAAVGTALLDLPPVAGLAVLWIAVGTTLLAVGPVLPAAGPSWSPPDGVRTTQRRVDPLVVLPVAAVLVAFWALVASAIPAAQVVIAGLALLAGGGLFVAVRDDDRGVSTAVVPLSGLVGVSFSLALVVVATAGVNPVRPAGAATLVVLCTAAVVAFHAYCDVTVRELRRSRLAPLRGPVRTAVAVLYLGVSAALVSPLLAPVGFSGPISGPLAPAAASLPGWALAVVFAPAGVVVASWLVYLARAGLSRAALAARATERSLPAPLVGGPPLFVVESPVPFARPLRVPRRGVVVSSGLVEALSERELAAVVAHERAHFADRSLDAALVATVVALAPGGRNALLAFVDVRASELAADDRAAAVVDAAAVRGALRTLERRRHFAPTGRNPIVRIATAPYRLFFGRALLDAAHPPVRDRCARLGDDSG